MAGTDVAQDAVQAEEAPAPKGKPALLAYAKIWLPFPVMLGALVFWQLRSGQLEKPTVAEQTTQILDSFDRMLRSVGSDLAHILHINVFLIDMADFAEMNDAYAGRLGEVRPARSAIAVTGLPKRGARVTMNLTAVARD